MPADQASKIFMAQDAHASWAKGCQSCVEAGQHEHMMGMGAQCQQSPGKGPAQLEVLVSGRIRGPCIASGPALPRPQAKGGQHTLRASLVSRPHVRGTKLYASTYATVSTTLLTEATTMATAPPI